MCDNKLDPLESLCCLGIGAALVRVTTKIPHIDFHLQAVPIKFVKHAPEVFFWGGTTLLDVFRNALCTNPIPTSWQTTIFKIVPIFTFAKFASNFRPIASLPLLYRMFAYFILGRMQDTLANSQPEEQHGYRNEGGLKKIC